MKQIINAIYELHKTMLAALAAADLRTRLREWWWVITGRSDGMKAVVNPRQARILVLLAVVDRVHNGQLQLKFGVSHETVRKDLAHLVNLGLLERQRTGRETFYTTSNWRIL